MAIDYYKMFLELAERHSNLIDQQKEIDIELAKLTQTLQSTFNLLTPSQQKKLTHTINRIESRLKGLKDGVLMALRARSGEWLTPPQVRDYLQSVGFDFGTSNTSGLASIGTTLKRMVPNEVETRATGSGQMAYRTKDHPLRSLSKAPKSMYDALLNTQPQQGETLKNAHEQSLDDDKNREKPWVNVIKKK